MKKLLITLIVIVVLAGAAGGAYYYKYGKPPEPEVSTVQVTRGDVVQLVAATGTVQAVTTVDVGTQVNGTIIDLYGTDFNKIVHKGDKIAKIDPKTIEAAIESDKANLESAQANLERQQIALEDSQNKLRRAKDLHDRKLLTDQDLETAEVTVKTNKASITSQNASIRQTQAKLDQDMVNLGYTDIYAPIDGIVINRKVDVGQTVVSNNLATSMFQIAQDLTKMQLQASVDESDVGWLRPGQSATFTVDAYLGRTFSGVVSQVRLQPVVSQNVVTYNTIINVPNPFYELKPGMTANVKIEIARAENVLRIPAAATRFRPTKEIFDALNLPMPPELQSRGRGRSQLASAGGQGSTGGNAAFQRGGGDRGTQATNQQATNRRGAGQGQSATAKGQAPSKQQQGQPGDRQAGAGTGGGRGQGGQQMTPEERQKRMQERLAKMTPEERAQFEERMKQFGQGGGRGQGTGRQGGQFAQNSTQNGRRNQPAANESTPGQPTSPGSGGTIDALFGPLTFPESQPTRVWVYSTDGKTKSLKPITIRTRIGDGTLFELTSGEGITEGMRLVSNIDTGLNNTSVRPNSTSPLMPGQQRGGPGNFGGGGGGGRGR